MSEQPERPQMTNAELHRKAFNTRETAWMIGVSVFQVRALIASGELKHVPVGKHFRVREAEIDRYLVEHEQAGVA